MFKPAMASVTVVLYKQKTLSNGDHPLMLRIIKDRKPSYRSIGHSCKPAWWDDANNCPNKKHPYKFQLEILIENTKQTQMFFLRREQFLLQQPLRFRG